MFIFSPTSRIEFFHLQQEEQKQEKRREQEKKVIFQITFWRYFYSKAHVQYLSNT